MNRKAILAAAVMAVGLGSASLQATTLSWDADGTLPLGGSGTWDTVTPLWTPDGASYVNWNNATPDSAVLGGTAGTVTLAEPITSAALTINTANYVIDLNGTTFTIIGATGGTVPGNITYTNTAAAPSTFSVGTLTGGARVTGNLNLTIGGNWTPSNVNDFSGTFTFKPTAAGATLLPNNTNTLGLPSSQLRFDASLMPASSSAVINWSTPDNTQIHTFAQNIDITHGASPVQFRVNGVKEVTLAGSISGGTSTSGGSGLIWAGANQGDLVLAGSNSYTGPTTISGQSDMLTLANNFALGQTTGVTMGSTIQTLAVRGNVDIANTSDININTETGGQPASGFGHIHSSGGTNRLSNKIIWTNVSTKFFGADAGSKLTLAGVLGGVNAAGITKVGQGTLVLTGANIYGNNNVSTSANATAVNEGTVRVDFSQSAIDQDIINNPTGNSSGFSLTSNQSSELTLGGGVFEVVGRSGATNLQQFKNPGSASVGFTINAGASAIRMVQNGATSLSLNVGRLRTGDRLIGGTVDMTLPTAGSIILPSQAGAVGADNTILTAHGVAFATIDGTDWAATDAVVSSKRNIIAGSTIAGFYTANAPDDLSGNADMSAGADTQLTASKSITSLRFHNSGARTIDLNGQTLTTGGILVTNTGNVSSSIIGGTLRAGSSTLSAANQDLVIIQNNTAGPLTISSQIVDNSDGTTAATALTKSGAGKLILTASNTYTGETHINGGVLQLQGAGTINSGKLVFHGGVLGLPGGTTLAKSIGTSGGSMQFLGSGGFAGYGGNVTINFGGTGTLGGTNGFVPTGSALILGAADSDGTVFIDSALSLRAPNSPQQREIRVLDGSAAVDARLNLGITSNNDDGGLSKTGDGVLELGAAGNYNGQTIIEAGTLRMAAANAIGTTTAVTVRAGTLDLNGNNYNANRVQLTLGGGAAGTSANITTGAGVLTFGTNIVYNGNVANDNGATISGNATMTAVRTFTVNDSTAAANDLTVSAVIAGSGGGIVKAGPGTLKLAANNTYTGGTTVNAGSLVVGSANALGTGSVTVNSGGTLQLQPGLAPVTIANLTFAGTGILDLTNDTLITNGTLPTTKSQIQAGNIITNSSGLVPGYFDQGGGSIKLRGTVPADANLDGTISSLDFDALAANFNSNTNVFWQHGDFNGDGTVNMLDFNILATDFGQSVPAAPALGTLVPEPAAMGLIALGAIGAMRRRRRSA